MLELKCKFNFFRVLWSRIGSAMQNHHNTFTMNGTLQGGIRHYDGKREDTGEKMRK